MYLKNKYIFAIAMFQNSKKYIVIMTFVIVFHAFAIVRAQTC